MLARTQKTFNMLLSDNDTFRKKSIQQIKTSERYTFDNKLYFAANHSRYNNLQI
jgi:hypothetical protein